MAVPAGSGIVMLTPAPRAVVASIPFRRMPAVMMRPRSLLALLAALAAAGCGDAPLPEAVTDAAVTPPSVRAEAAAPAAAPPAAVVRLTAAQADELQVRTVTVGLEAGRFVVTLPGEVYPAPDHLAQVSAPISGRVAAIYAHEGEGVRRGQPLLALESLEFANLAADYMQAVAEEAYQQQQVDRLATLVEKKIAPRSRLDRAEADLARARASVSATYARLKALGIADDQMTSWSDATRARPLLPIYAPITGVIDRHGVDLGQSVTAYQEMMTVINPAKVLIRGFASPDDAPAIAPGDAVEVRLKDVPGRTLRAAVTTINPAVDPSSRAVTVNVAVPTQDGWPMPGQTVQLAVEASRGRPTMTLPLSAVQYEGEQATVFVRTGPDTFEKRPVEIARVGADEVTVTAGLDEGDEVAVSQVFSLKALGRFEQYAE